jgi:hypothetical protein
MNRIDGLMEYFMEAITFLQKLESKKHRRIGSRLLMAAALLIAAGACSGDSDEPAVSGNTSPTTARQNSPDTNASQSLPADTCTYSETNPLSPVEGTKARVFGFCLTEDPFGDTGIYKQPEQIEGTAVGKVANDTLVDLVCVTDGQPIQDSRGQGTNDGSEGDIHDSVVWAKIRTPQGLEGYIPEVWLGYIKAGTVPNC